MQSPWLVSLQALSPLVTGWGPFSGMGKHQVEEFCVSSDPINSLLTTICLSSHFCTIEKLFNWLIPLRDQCI
jgi:hypothetical protein